MRSRVCETERCPSVCLSQHGPAAANPLLQVCCCWPGDWLRRQRLAGGECDCGQWHVVSVCRKLNTDTLVSIAPVTGRPTAHHRTIISLFSRVLYCNQSIQFIRQKGPKATYKSQYTIYNDYSARQCIQYVKNMPRKKQFTNYVKFSLSK